MEASFEEWRHLSGRYPGSPTCTAGIALAGLCLPAASCWRASAQLMGGMTLSPLTDGPRFAECNAGEHALSAMRAKGEPVYGSGGLQGMYHMVLKRPCTKTGGWL